MDYPLAEYGELVGAAGEDSERKVGVYIRCPNCRMLGAAYFKTPIGGGHPPAYANVQWDRTGETLETLTLNPSFLMYDHFHSWIRNGKLCVDSPFSCTKRE